MKGPGGAWQWTPTDDKAKGTVPDAHDPKKSHAPMMFTTDLALKMDPAYAKISKRFHENPKEFDAAFAKAWYKLTHRDMGPVSRSSGRGSAEPQLWQDPVPKVDHKLIDKQDIAALKGKILESGCPPPNWSRPPGRPPRRTAAPTSAAGPTGHASVSPRRRTGRRTNPTSLRKSSRCLRRSKPISTRRMPTGRRSRSRT